MTDAKLEPIFKTKKKMKTSMDATTLKLIVNYCYTNVMRMNDYEQMFKVFKFAKEYGIIELIDDCKKCFGEAVHMTNVLSFWNLSKQHEFHGMNKLCWKTINDLFMQIVKQPSFNELTSHDLGKIISSDRLHSPNEETVFAVFLKWLTKSDDIDVDIWHYEDKVNAIQDSDDISALLSHIRFPLMSPQVTLTNSIPFKSIDTNSN